jgi:hypothetical protein
MTVKDARSFLAAIKQSTGNFLEPNQFDDEAAEYLEMLSENVFTALDNNRIKGRTRDRLIFFDGMLKGVILKLRKRVLETGTELQDKNLLTEDKKLKEN